VDQHRHDGLRFVAIAGGRPRACGRHSRRAIGGELADRVHAGFRSRPGVRQELRGHGAEPGRAVLRIGRRCVRMRLRTEPDSRLYAALLVAAAGRLPALSRAIFPPSCKYALRISRRNAQPRTSRFRDQIGVGSELLAPRAPMRAKHSLPRSSWSLAPRRASRSARTDRARPACARSRAALTL
jgi:hypothetical protein